MIEKNKIKSELGKLLSFTLSLDLHTHTHTCTHICKHVYIFGTTQILRILNSVPTLASYPGHFRGVVTKCASSRQVSILKRVETSWKVIVFLLIYFYYMVHWLDGWLVLCQPLLKDHSGFVIIMINVDDVFLFSNNVDFISKTKFKILHYGSK